MPPTTSIKPITIYGKNGPNPPKIRILCEELQIPYTTTDIPFSSLKAPPFLAINPNGRIPALHDPNTSLTLWESGAIIQYLIDTYDASHALSFPQGTNEAHLARQWLFFQTSGQGPYYGQAVWFAKYHPERVVSAQDRYCREIERVTAVLERHLERQGKGDDGPWLVGGRFSYADLAFVTWQSVVEGVLEGKVDLSPYKEVKGWMERMKKREAVGKVVGEGFGGK